MGAVSWAISAGLDVFENAFLQEQKTDQTRLSKLSKILKILIYNFQWKFEQAKQQSVCGERRPHIMGFAERKSSEQDPMLKVGFELYFWLQKVFFPQSIAEVTSSS